MFIHITERPQPKFEPGQKVEIDIRKWLHVQHPNVDPLWKEAEIVAPLEPFNGQYDTTLGIFHEDAIRKRTVSNG